MVTTTSVAIPLDSMFRKLASHGMQYCSLRSDVCNANDGLCRAPVAVPVQSCCKVRQLLGSAAAVRHTTQHTPRHLTRPAAAKAAPPTSSALHMPSQCHHPHTQRHTQRAGLAVQAATSTKRQPRLELRGCRSIHVVPPSAQNPRSSVTQKGEWVVAVKMVMHGISQVELGRLSKPVETPSAHATQPPRAHAVATICCMIAQSWVSVHSH